MHARSEFGTSGSLRAPQQNEEIGAGLLPLNRSLVPAIGMAASLVIASAGSEANAAEQAPTSGLGPTVSGVTVPGSGRRDDTPPKLDHIMPEVAGVQITVTKKTTVIKLDQQPTIIGNNQVQLFSRAGGVFVSQQQTPAQANLSYRGIGNPQEAEYVLVLQDGIPIQTDWIGFPTLYFMPLPQSVSEVQVIRGGSSLLFGPEPAPAINFVSRRPQPGAQSIGETEHAAGSNALYSTYSFLQGSHGSLLYRADLGYVRSDGQRENSDYDRLQAGLYLAYAPDATETAYLDLKGYRLNAGEPGRLTLAQYIDNPNFAPSPYNHIWVDRLSATLGYSRDFTPRLRLETKGWATYQALDTRSAAALTASGVAPATTTLQDTQFKSEGAELRLRQRVGRGAATAGVVAYRDAAPLRSWTVPDLRTHRDNRSGAVRQREQRSTAYQALFGEYLVRFGRFHLVSSARVDHETIQIRETVKPPAAPTEPLPRPPYNLRESRTVTSLGLGIGNDFGRGNETYLSISQGWRPLRYFDVAPPGGNLQPGREPDAPRSLDIEAGVHGTPIPGLWYDVGVFWMQFKNRVESQVIGPANTDTINVNSGDTRHRGVDSEVSYDVLARSGGPSHMIAFANIQWLDAEFTSTRAAGVAVGNHPAFAPRWMVKGGLTWRYDGLYTVSLTGQTLSPQFFQDTNQPTSAAGVVTVPAKVPAFTVFDLAGDYNFTQRVRLVGGVSNLGDRRYYARVFQNGIEPAPRRTAYVGLSLKF